MIQRRSPLRRGTASLKRTPIRRVSTKRAKQLREYATRRDRYLAENPICQVWLREKGWTVSPNMPGYFSPNSGGNGHYSAETLVEHYGAFRSAEIHHVNKRRGAMLNDETHWIAVCRKNHERIENDKAWARREGFLLNF